MRPWNEHSETGFVAKAEASATSEAAHQTPLGKRQAGTEVNLKLWRGAFYLHIRGCENMFSIETIKEIKNLASEINVNEEIVKKIFVEKLELNAPELLHIFSQILQKSGRSKISLIQAVYTAVMQIEHVDRFVPTLMQVAHKHRSLGIQPEHYAEVLEHLTDSIRDALGERATDKGMDACIAIGL